MENIINFEDFKKQRRFSVDSDSLEDALYSLQELKEIVQNFLNTKHSKITQEKVDELSSEMASALIAVSEMKLSIEKKAGSSGD